MMRLIPLPAFRDNDLWFLHDGRRALVVDPGDAQPVPEALQRDGLELEAILVTHHEKVPEPLTRPETPAPMLHSVEKLAALAGETRVCCTDEYTLSNLKFAQAVEPGNLQLINDSKRCEELRAQDLPTLQVNPFLRTRVPAVVQAARGHDAATAPDEVGEFATLRQWKNAFR